MTGWIDPTLEQRAGARRLLTANPDPAGFALTYIGSILNRMARADFGADDIRRAIAMYQAWDEEASK